MITREGLFSPAYKIWNFIHIHETVQMYMTMYYVSLVKFNSCQKLITPLSASSAHCICGLHTHRHSVNPAVTTHSTSAQHECHAWYGKKPTTTKVNLNLVYVVPVPGRLCSQTGSYSICTRDSFTGATKHLGCEAQPFTSIQH